MSMLDSVARALRIKKRSAAAEYLEVIKQPDALGEGGGQRIVELAQELGTEPIDADIHGTAVREFDRLGHVIRDASRAREERDNLGAKIDELLAERARVLAPINAAIRDHRAAQEALTHRVASDADAALQRGWIVENWPFLFPHEKPHTGFNANPPRQQYAITPAITAAIARRDQARRELAGEPEPGARVVTYTDGSAEAARRAGQHSSHVMDEGVLFGPRLVERRNIVGPMTQQTLGRNGRPTGEATPAYRQPASIAADVPLPGEAADEAADEAEKLPGK